MQSKYEDIKSISDLHNLYGCEKPKHPLVSVINLVGVNASKRFQQGVNYRLCLYSIFSKKYQGVLRYGKSHYDFNEGSLMFTAPNQVISAAEPGIPVEEGWGLFFHPDLINSTSLGRKINEYSFFHYDTNEALHISDEEKTIIKECVENIEREYSRNIDKHTQGLIIGNIELLLNYCDRFYDRQFFTRAKVNNDTVQSFENLLTAYFAQDSLIEAGLPDVKYFATALNMSPNYLSDVLKRFTGKSTLEHIHLQLTEMAKSLLWGTDKSVGEIAYELGFEHPSHFTKIFKTKTGKSPTEYRHLN